MVSQGHQGGGFFKGARFLGFVAPLNGAVLIADRCPMRLLFNPVLLALLICKPILLGIAPALACRPLPGDNNAVHRGHHPLGYPQHVVSASLASK